MSPENKMANSIVRRIIQNIPSNSPRPAGNSLRKNSLLRTAQKMTPLYVLASITVKFDGHEIGEAFKTYLIVEKNNC